MLTKKQKLQSNIKKLYIIQILFGSFFSVPVIVLFWQENGLSLTEIMILQSFFAIITVALEIPTGYFADVYGRKNSLIVAMTSAFLGITTYSLGHNFWHFLFAEALFAFMASFMSGALSAFTYDTLKDLKIESQYKKIWGNIMFYGIITLALANALGGFIGEYNLRYTLIASIPFYFLLIPVTLSLHEPKRHKKVIKKGYTKELLQVIKKTLKNSKKLKWIIIYSAVIYAFNQSALWFYQPYLEISGLSIIYFGFVFAGFQVVAAFSSKYSYKLERVLGKKYSLGMLIFLVSISFLLMSNFVYFFSFSFCFIQQFIRGFKNTVINDYINGLTKSEIRATILSVESFLSRLLYAIVIPIFGWVADLFSVLEALSLIGISSFVSGVVMYVVFKRDKVV